MKSGLLRQTGAWKLGWPVPYLLCRPATGKPRALVVLLHRYGGHHERFARIVDRLGLEDCAFLVPRGPFRVMAGKGEIGYAWAVSTPREPDPEGLDFSRDLVRRLTRRTLQVLSPARRTAMVLGHSQGGFLALHSLLDAPRLFAGAVSLGGQMNPSLAMGKRCPPGRRAFLSHGEADDLAPIRCAEAAVELLAGAGVDARLARYPGVGHWPTRQMYQDAGRWIGERISAIPTR